MLNRYCIVALVPDPWAKDIDELRRQHDKWSKQWLPAHITVVAPFEASLSHDLVAEIEGATVPIQVRLGGWGVFEHFRTNTVWIEGSESATANARRQLIQTVPRLGTIVTEPSILWDEAPSHHITVVNHVPHDALAELRQALDPIDLEGSFTISHLTVFAWDRRLGRWLKVRPS